MSNPQINSFQMLIGNLRGLDFCFGGLPPTVCGGFQNWHGAPSSTPTTKASQMVAKVWNWNFRKRLAARRFSIAAVLDNPALCNFRRASATAGRPMSAREIR
jgi:hypothetical protein